MESALPGSTSQLSDHVVQAGAGAGKTRSLVEKVVSVFREFREKQGKSPHLIVTTFTRKATQELRERLIVRACEQKDSELLEYVGNARALHISTIHGVLNLFLSQVGHLCQLEAGFRIIHDNEERQVASKALKKILLTAEDDLFWVEDYSFTQLLAILIRFSKAFSHAPDLCPATFEDLQALRDEVVIEARRNLTGIADRILNAGTNDSKWTEFATQLKGFASHWNGSAADLSEAAPSKPRRSAKSAFTEEFQNEIGSALKSVKDEMNKIEEYAEFWPFFASKWDAFFDLGRRFHHEFWNSKLNEGLLSISDLEIFSLQVLREKPFLGGNFSAGWDFWLIDEYQDTSPVQAELLQRLRGKSAEFVVGDPQQSIYLFRGARSEMFHAKIEQAKLKGAQIDQLSVNYRSDPGLLLFLNDFFVSYSGQFEAMRPRESSAGGSQTVARFISAPTKAEEDQGLLAHVSELLKSGARYEDICVLARTHSHLAAIASVLKEHGIPVQVHSPTGFWRRREVLDAMALLKFLVHPHDNLTLLSLLRSPGFRVPDDALAGLMQSKPKSLWSLFRETDHEAVPRLLALLEKRSKDGLIAAFEEGLRDSALFDLAYHADPAGRREANLWKLFSRIKEEEKKPGFQVLNLVEQVEGLVAEELVSEGDAIAAAEPNCVNLMTIHSSKGLEFDHVIVPRMGVAPNLTTHDIFSHHEDDATFSFPVYLEQEGKTVSSPLDRRRISELRRRELAEQDRWLYVALTRAKKSLALSWSDDQLENDSWAVRGRLVAAERFGHSEKYKVEIRRPPFELKLAPPADLVSGGVRPEWKEKDAAPPKPEKQTVSQMAKASEADATIRGLLLRQEGAAYGIGLHRAFQTLKVRPDIQWAVKAHPDLKEALEYVWNLESPCLREVITNGYSEWGFKIRTESGLMQGRIDLWGKDSSGKLWIVDYKSGRSHGAGDDSHWEQLKLYAWALREFGHREPIELALVHPLEKKTFVKSYEP